MPGLKPAHDLRNKCGVSCLKILSRCLIQREFVKKEANTCRCFLKKTKTTIIVPSEVECLLGFSQTWRVQCSWKQLHPPIESRPSPMCSPGTPILSAHLQSYTGDKCREAEKEVNSLVSQRLQARGGMKNYWVNWELHSSPLKEYLRQVFELKLLVL